MVRTSHIAVLLFAALAAALSPSAQAADLRFVVQPIIDRDSTRKAFQPMADYLSAATGKSIVLVTAFDYADYWLSMKQGNNYDLVLDAPYYVDYRIKTQNHVPLAKVQGVVSYSLIARSSAAFLDTVELIGKKVASLTPPAPGGLVMGEMFPNPFRQPYVQPVKSSEEALELLLAGKVDAAMVPTPLAAQAMSQGKDVTTIATSKQTPHITLTAGPNVDPGTRDKITEALLNATKTAAGREMLKQIGFPAFEPTSASLYDGYIKYLNQAWGNR